MTDLGMVVVRPKEEIYKKDKRLGKGIVNRRTLSRESVDGENWHVTG